MKINKKNIKLIVGLILLIILVCIFFLRWQTLAYKTENSKVFKWEKNILTGEIILKEFSQNGMEIKHINQIEYLDGKKYYTYGNNYMGIYTLFVIGTTIFLIIQLIKYKRST